MINRINVKNFVSMKETGDIPLKHFNVLIGQNGSGKSNFTESLRVVRELARGTEIEPAIIKSFYSKKNVFFMGQSKDDLEIQIEFSDYEQDRNYGFYLRVHLNEREKLPDQLIISSEHMFILDGGIKKLIYQREGLDVTFLSKKKLPIKVNQSKVLFSYYQHQALELPTSILKSVFLVEGFDLISETSPVVSMAKINYKKIDDLAIYLKNKDEKLFAKSQEIIKKIIPHFAGNDVIDLGNVVNDKKGNNEEVFLSKWTQKYSDLTFDASSLSNGDRRIIYLILVLFFINENSTLIIEEIENGIHVGRIGLFLDQVRTQADNRNIQLVFTTHSREILGNVAAKDVIYCRFDKNKGSSYKRMNEHEGFSIIKEDLEDEGSAKDYFDSGIYN